jgi:hypothetical protein
LLIGVLVFSFYCFRPAPLHFNSNAYQVFKDKQPVVAAQMEQQYAILHSESSRMAYSMSATRSEDPQLSAGFLSKRAQMQQLRDSVQHIITRNGYSPDSGDTNYIFLYFVQHSLPAGLVGLVFAVIILASWGSISAALNALAATSLVDIHLDHLSNYTNVQQVKLGRLHTLGWGVFCVFVAMFAARLGSLIEAVNVLGSLFYGTILGIFLVAFYCKSISGKSVLRAAVIAEAAIIVIYCLDIVSFLWLNVAGALFVIALGYLFQLARKN